ncbi:MAG: DUF2313 domain-containing protein [Pseudodesulfovibrio sp.]|nr:DUF2313 domain-containing protein [Pseudodesulfovibrio sp.]
MQSYTPEQYLDMLLQLLPPGAAWPREEGEVRDALLGATAQEFHRVDKDTLLMVSESNPLRTILMLEEWEIFAGLPDECSQSYETVAERRAAVVAKITATGGQSLAYLVEMATNFTGQVCTGQKFQAFRAGASTAGESLTNDPWDYWYGIHVPDTVVRPFCAGASMAGEPLNTWGHERLVCIINQLGPAEGQAQLTYGGNDG